MLVKMDGSKNRSGVSKYKTISVVNSYWLESSPRARPSSRELATDDRHSIRSTALARSRARGKEIHEARNEIYRRSGRRHGRLSSRRAGREDSAPGRKEAAHRRSREARGDGHGQDRPRGIAARERRRDKPMVEKTCAFEGCGRVFESANPNRVYCSDRCRMAAFARRRARGSIASVAATVPLRPASL